MARGCPAATATSSIQDGRSSPSAVAPATHTGCSTPPARVVAPGFIDPHTHYDAQLCFDPYAFPAIEHGVTTVVPGNCSLSLAPLRADQRDAFSRMFRLIEEMPEAAFDAGVDWRWGEGFGGWLDALAENIALNVAPLVGHSVLRMYVMGPEAQQRAATADEIRAMADLLRVCLDAGAVGLSTSFVDIDETYRPVPSRWAAPEELDALSAVLGERDARAADRPRVLRHRADDRPRRAARRAVAAPRHHHHAVAAVPLRRQPRTASAAIMARRRGRTSPWRRGVAAGADPSDRHQLHARPAQPDAAEHAVVVEGRLDPRPRREARRRGRPAPGAGRRDGLAGQAARRRSRRRRLRRARRGARAQQRPDRPQHRRHRPRTGRRRAARRVVDLALDEDLGTWFIRESIGHDNSPVVGDLLAHPYVHVGASDGGAHVGSFSTFGDTGYLFSEFVRGTKSLSLEAAVKKITLDPATIWGLEGRGLLAEGNAADVVVFDADTIGRGPEIASDDFPGDGIRWIRRQEGVDTVVVNGEVTWSADGGYVGRRPRRADRDPTVSVLPAGCRSHVVTVGDGRVHCVEAGEGPLVLLVHGFPESLVLVAPPAAGARRRPATGRWPSTCAATAARRSRSRSRTTAWSRLVADNVGLVARARARRAVDRRSRLGRADRVDLGAAAARRVHRRGRPVGAVRRRPSDMRPTDGDAGDGAATRSSTSSTSRSRAGPRPRSKPTSAAGCSGFTVHRLGRRPAAGPGGGTVATVRRGGSMKDRFRRPDPLPAWLTEADLDVYASEFEHGLPRRAEPLPQRRSRLGGPRRVPWRARSTCRRCSSVATATVRRSGALGHRRVRRDAAEAAPLDHPRRAAATGPSRNAPTRSTPPSSTSFRVGDPAAGRKLLCIPRAVAQMRQNRIDVLAIRSRSTAPEKSIAEFFARHRCRPRPEPDSRRSPGSGGRGAIGSRAIVRLTCMSSSTRHCSLAH